MQRVGIIVPEGFQMLGLAPQSIFEFANRQTAGERRRSPDHRRDAAVHPRFRSAGANDQHRSRTLRPDAGVVSEPDQSRVGAMELRARRQSLTPFPYSLSQPQGFPWKTTKRSHYAY